MNTPRATIKVAQRRIFLPESWSLLTLGRRGDRDVFVNPGPSIQTIINLIDLSQYMPLPDNISYSGRRNFLRAREHVQPKGTMGTTEA